MGKTYCQRLGVHAVLNHGDANGEGAAVEVAVLWLFSGRVSSLILLSGGSWRRRLTRMVAISCRMSTACWAAACFSARSLGGILGGRCLLRRVEMCG